ncbi:hypothetical protein MAR_006266 [Mya arenaria]|uniref:Uncharacterized protein n=1 Tax=Mya arenaria TaxID=6604 RepID=A0ABY7DAQ1_MYAAR|nr:hypothetical protein MAR_006219 [Mya arenaria]WAQ93795.1 hypothetical protein MAR_006266 [Mya arenaria]
MSFSNMVHKSPTLSSAVVLVVEDAFADGIHEDVVLEESTFSLEVVPLVSISLSKDELSEF